MSKKPLQLNEATTGGVQVERTVRPNDFQNGNSSKLPSDVCRCVTKTCHVRDLCARFMDCEYGGGVLSFADLTNECHDIGVEQMFIPWRGVPTQEHKLEHKNTTA